MSTTRPTAYDTCSVPQIQRLLANRLLSNANLCDSIRDNRRNNLFSPQDYADKARMLAEALAALAEVERIWEALFGYVPSLAEVHQVAHGTEYES